VRPLSPSKNTRNSLDDPQNISAASVDDAVPPDFSVISPVYEPYAACDASSAPARATQCDDDGRQEGSLAVDMIYC
jgi:hypothetical protein